MKSVEIWRAIPGFEGLYEVSNQGRVRSLRLKNGIADRLRDTPLIMRPGERAPQRYGLQLAVGGKYKTFAVARLVALAFCVRPNHCDIVAHLDGNPSNNHAGNLAWVTIRENAEHRSVHGTQQIGEDNFSARLTEKDVREIRAEPESVSHSQLARKYGVVLGTISAVRKGKTWKNV